MTAPVLPAQAVAGTELPPRTLRFTRQTLVRYAGASGDFNPIHYSDYHARALGLDGVIAHGMLTMGSALRTVTEWAGSGAVVRSVFTRFSRPVPVPDDESGAELTVTATVSAVADDPAGRRITVAVDAVCGGERVLRGMVAELVLAGRS